MVRYERFLAAKLLMRAHRQRFIPLVAILSVAGIAVGVAALIIVISVMSGFEEDLQKKITAMSAHVWVQPRAEAVDEPLLKTIAGAPDVEAAGLYVTTQALLRSPHNTTGAVLFGLDRRSAVEVVRLSDNRRSGEVPDFSSAAAEIYMGNELAAALRVYPGDTVDLLTARGAQAGVPIVLRVRVAGTFEVGMYDYDAHTAYLPLASLRKLIGKDAVPGAMVRVSSIFGAHATARELEELVGPGYAVRDWLAMNRNLLWCRDTDPHLVTFDAQDGDRHLVTNHQRLTDSPCQDQH